MSNFMPHGMCYLWQPGLIALHAISDALIALAYVLISFTLFHFVRKRRDLKFRWMFVCFAIFIVACGMTHVVEIWAVWDPVYWLLGTVKAITALASVPTAILLMKLVPHAMQLPSPSALQQANADLRKEIVERERAERDVRGMSGWYRALVEAAPDAMVISDASGRIMLVNAQTERVFGYSRDELIGQLVDVLVPEQLRDKHPGYRADYTAHPRARAMGADLELCGLRKDATQFPVEISLSPIETPDGTLVSSSIRDITDRRRVERALQEKNVELERASRAKDQFLASMSHELRTPLNAVIGFTGTLLMRLPGPLTSDQEKQLRTVQASARHLLSLINDLLDLAKIESGNVELNLQPVPVCDVVREVCTSLQPAAQKKGLVLNLQLPAAELMARTDRRSLSQILINLTNNAIKFTERGEVRLEVTRVAIAGATALHISVVDGGIGIRQEDQVRLFEAFGKVGKGEAKAAESTGLGLHLSRKLAELLGGTISLSSVYGSGSRFTLSLPELQS